jgi:lipoprotein signal peptidase
VFNVADSAIVVGVLVIVLLSARSSRPSEDESSRLTIP